MGIVVDETVGGITPACAGNTLQNDLSKTEIRDHPRMSGEYKQGYRVNLNVLGSPPHARGILWKAC